MIRSPITLTVLVLFAGGPSRAEQKAGPETKALQPLAGTRTVAGTKTPPGAVPSVATSGTYKCSWTTGGLWLSCTIEQRMADTRFPPFTGQLIVGWDIYAKEYRGFFATSQGVSMTIAGKMDGKKLVLESAEIATPRGKARARFSYDLTDPKAIKHTDERMVNGGPWTKFEESVLK